MADIGFEQNGLIYIKNVIVIEQTLHNMGRICSWFVSGGTIKIKILEHNDFVSVTHRDDFIKHFPVVDFTACHNRK